MASVNNPILVNAADPTTAVFETFYNPQGYNVDASTYDAVIAFFIKQSKSPSQAKKLADILFRIANDLTIEPTQLLYDMENNKSLTIDSQISYYLNLINSRTTLQGITTPIQPNYYAARSILD